METKESTFSVEYQGPSMRDLVVTVLIITRSANGPVDILLTDVR